MGNTTTYACHNHATHWTEDSDGLNPGCPICYGFRQPCSLVERVAVLEKQMQQMQDAVYHSQRFNYGGTK